MTDHTKHNAGIGKRFFELVEEGLDPEYLWYERLLIDGHPILNRANRFNFVCGSVKFTWKPETITIHGREVPKPMTKEPEPGQPYYYHSFEKKIEVNRDHYDGSISDHIYRFSLGVFLIRSECWEFAEAYYRPWEELVE